MEQFLYYTLQVLNVVAILLAAGFFGWILWGTAMWIKDEILIWKEKRR